MTQENLNHFLKRIRPNAMKFVIDNNKKELEDWLRYGNCKKYPNLFLEAATRGHKKICDLLLNHSKYSSDFDLNTAFSLACMYNKLSIVKLLSRSNVDILAGLNIASCCGHKRIVQWLLKKISHLLHTDIIKWIVITAGGSGDVYTLMGLFVLTSFREADVISHALQAACYGGQVHVTNLLLKYSSADINHITTAIPRFMHEMTPLTMAIAKGRTSIATKLLEERPDVDVNMCTGKCKDSALHYVISCDSHGFNTLNDHVGSPLHQACYNGEFARVCSLIYKSACKVNEQQNDGLTPLHWASEQGHVKIFLCLLSVGADLSIMSDRQKTPVDYATENNNSESHELLRYFDLL